jgi:hypothetical protein
MGAFTIDKNENLEEITGLQNLEYASSLSIQKNPKLNTINSFDKLIKLDGDLEVAQNESLKTIYGFNVLESTKNILIDDLANLDTLEGFNKIRYIDGDFKLHELDILKHLEGFNQLDSVMGRVKINELDSIQRWDICKELLFVGEELEITTNGELDTIIGFEQLNQCKDLFINGLDIKNLNGFNNLKFVNGVSINNQSLRSIRGFEKLSSAQGIYIANNDSLQYFNAFKLIETVDLLLFRGNNVLPIEIHGFNNLTKVVELLIEQIRHLKEVTAFNNVQYVDRLQIQFIHNNLNNLNFLKNLKQINKFIHLGHNRNLKDIGAIEGVFLDSLEQLSFTDNDSLSFCSHPTICNFIKKYPDKSYFDDNKEGCNSIEEILENCISSTTEDDVNPLSARVYPNPTSGIVFIESSNQSRLSFSIHNSLGQVVDFGWEANQIDLTNLPPGIYYVVFKDMRIGNKKILLLE